MKKRTAFHWSLSVALLSVLFVGVLASDVFADGTETLGPPSITIASGSGAVAAGVGLRNGQPGDITIDVPAGVTINQVLLYWEGQMSTDLPGDDTITVNGNSVTGMLIGGQAFFFSGAYSSAFRADITSLGLVAPGSNTLTIDGMDYTFFNNGAGVVVIYDDGSTVAELQIRDGLDLAFIDFPEPRKSTILQSYSIVPDDEARVADILIIASSVENNRPNSIEVTVDGALTLFSDLLDNSDGADWDTLPLTVDIPANASTVTVQLFSRDDSGINPNKEASLAWIGSILSIPEPETGNYQGLTPGFWKQPHHLMYWVDYSPTDDYETVFGVNASFTLTLLETLWQGGGKEKALGRHAVAAILNASHPDINYYYSVAEIIAIVQDAYVTGKFNAAKDLLEKQNQLGMNGGIK